MNTQSTPARQLNWLFNAYQAVIGRGGQIDWSRVGAGFAVGHFTVKARAAAIATAVAVLVDPLEHPLPAGTALAFAGSATSAILTDDADVGEDTLAVEPLASPVADNAEATADYTGAGDKHRIPGGTVMARTAEDKLIPRADADTEEATEILQSDAIEDSKVHAKSGYGTLIEAQVFENLLPDADDAGDIPAGYKTELADNGARINFSDWSDSRFEDA